MITGSEPSLSGDTITYIAQMNTTTIDETKDYLVFLKTLSIPDYAEKYPDNSGRYLWREISPYSNEDIESELGKRPFANGCHYVHTDINFFLRRQDPEGDYGLNITESIVGQCGFISQNRLCRTRINGEILPEIEDTQEYETTNLLDLC